MSVRHFLLGVVAVIAAARDRWGVVVERPITIMGELVAQVTEQPRSPAAVVVERVAQILQRVRLGNLVLVDWGGLAQMAQRVAQGRPPPRPRLRARQAQTAAVGAGAVM